MKRLPFFDKTFVIRLKSSKRIVSVIRTDGDPEQSPMVDISADRVFVMRTRVLYKVVRHLISDPDGKERMAYGTGYRFANVLTLDDFVPVQTNNSSTVHVDPDPESRILALSEFDRYGDALQCLFHSHPGVTEHSVHPSSTDVETLQNLEKHYGTVGAICNAGGFIEFFSASQLFQIVIVGKGVEDYGFSKTQSGFRHLFRLSLLDGDSLPTTKRGWLGRVINRQAREASLVRPKETEPVPDDLIRTGRWIPRG